VEQRRLLLVVVLSVVILVSYNELVLRRYEKPRPTPAPGTPVEPSTQAPAKADTAKPPSELAAPTEGDEAVVVETDVVRATFTTVGARLKELRLKHYRRSVESDAETLNLVQDGEVLPLTVRLGPEESDAALLYKADRTGLTLVGSERGEITFTAQTPGGLQLEKRVSFAGDDYLFLVAARASGSSAPKTIGLVMTPIPHDHTASTTPEVALALEGNKLIHESVAELPKAPKTLVNSTWSGFGVQYFLSAAVPVPSPVPAVMTAIDGLPIVQVDNPVAQGEAKFAIFMGPKDHEILVKAGLGLDRALDFGWFWFVAVPLLQGMKWLHALTGNYGVAIILLTTLVKIATIPLTQTTFKSMREMQRIQPQIQKLRERFKDDQVALQKETMELYRRHHVNPLSGCLPMLLQLPIFVGLYNALQYAIELRHAPFGLWINDLSAPDRLMVGGIGVPVLTILMGISMFAQQWLTPQQGDPVQQRMMMIMPVIFTFMMINFPAGLVLYWLVNNILTIGQQYWMMRRAA
jgi:YidC/Oxa1 family membrane protein insertase